MARLRVALLGAGRLGAAHARTLAGLTEARLVSVADPRPEGRRLAETLDARPVADPMDAIGDSGVDAVVIVTPTATHAELIEAAARAGKAIFCEKPIALDVPTTERALAVVAQTGVPLQIGFQRRYDSGFAEAHRRIAAGEIGKVHMLRSVSHDPYPPSREYILGCGGQFVDMSIHDLDIARFVTGLEVESVSAFGSALGAQAQDFCDAGDWDTTVLNLRFVGGGVGSIVNSRQSGYGYDIHTDVLGDTGGLKVGYERFTPITRYSKAGATHDYVPYFPERFAQAYAAELVAFIHAVQEGKPVTPTGQDGLASLKIALAATQSARQGGVPVAVA
ncbi:MAG TPA: inositol 2-dehydrogenase [Chloroflexota bacterium]|nr:inositol 2-dehydrogenase [Chloroflexota bacterium]